MVAEKARCMPAVDARFVALVVLTVLWAHENLGLHAWDLKHLRRARLCRDALTLTISAPLIAVVEQGRVSCAQLRY